MKNNIIYILTVFILLGSLASCEVEDRLDLPPKNLTASDLQFTVSQNPEKDNEVTLKSDTPKVLPYWSYFNGQGRELGHSNEEELLINFPFAGDYVVNYTAYSQGGPIEAAPVTVKVSGNDEEYFSDQEWDMLTNGVAGKTWVLDMVSPIGWAGLDYPYNPDGADYWNWYPDYAGNSWVMEDKDWGEMSFDLDGGYNVSVTQTALDSNEQITTTGTYTFDIENHNIKFNGGVELLYGGDYYADVSNWTSVNVVELTENSLRLSVIRDQSRAGEGVTQIVFHYKPKE